jgi:hypothetical protein
MSQDEFLCRLVDANLVEPLLADVAWSGEVITAAGRAIR